MGKELAVTEDNPFTGLTDRQLSFVLALIEQAETTGRFNLSDAALAAGVPKGQERQRGWELRHNPKVERALRFAVSKKAIFVTPMAQQMLIKCAEGDLDEMGRAPTWKERISAAALLMQFGDVSRAGQKDELNINFNDNRSEEAILASIENLRRRIKDKGAQHPVLEADFVEITDGDEANEE